MADINELFSALQKADAAGNKEDARQIANMIRQVGGYSAPKEPEEKPDTGFTGAAKASYQTLKGDIAALAGKTGLMDVNEAEKYQQERQAEAKRIFKPTEAGWTESPWEKLKETAGGSLPYMAAPLAVGVAASGAPAAVGLGAAGLASATQFAGSNLSRQMEEGKSLKDTDLIAAGAAAIPQAALDVVGLKYIPGIQKIFKSVGQNISEQTARDMLAQGTWRTAGQYIAGGAKIAGIEGGTEAGQQFFERLQAGLNIADKDARKEYLDNFIGGAVLGGVASPAGVHGTRSEARDVVAKADAAQAATTQQEQEAQTQQAELTKQQQATGNLFGEAAPTEKQVSPLPNAPATLTVREQEAEAAQTKEAQTSERNRLLGEADKFDKQLLDIEKQRDAAAEKGDFKTFGALDSQARALEETLKKVTSSLKELPANLSPEMEMAKLRGEQKSLIKQLQGMTGPSYDAKKAATVTTKLHDIDKRIGEITPAASQLDMFDEAQMGAAQRESENKQKEDRAQEQADMFAQVQTEGKKEVLNKDTIDRYQKGLVDLEDAYAAGADERIINRLVAELQRVGEAKDEAVAKAQGKTGPQQEEELAKIARIKRAIDEENAKLYSATTDEEVNAIRANVGALQKRYAAAQDARAKGQPENVEIDANQEQKDAVLQAVEGARSILSGDYLNSRNVDVASSLKSGIEADIRDAGAAYTKAAIKEINAVREINKQQPLTNDEALKVASAVKERFDHIAADPTHLSNREIEISRLKKALKETPKENTKRREKLESSIKELEKNRNANLKEFQQALDRIKSGHFKGASRLQKATPVLKQERDVVGMLRKEMAKKEPDQKRIAQLQKEVAAGKKEEERIAAEKEKQEAVDMERYAPSGVNPDQKELFGEKQLEPAAVVRATPENFQRFVGIQANKFKQAKEAAERVIAEAKERAAKAKERAEAKATETAQELSKQIAEQRALVEDVSKKDIIISDLRGQATRLWQERGRLLKELKTATKENKKIIKNAIDEIDNTTEERNKQIDELHAKANELQKANLEREKALLARLEKAYEKTPEARSKLAIAAARAEIGKTEAAIDANLKKQIKEQRVAEQKAMEFKASLPSTTRETVETLKQVKGKGGETLRREKITRREVPLTAEEKKQQAIEKARAGAAERKADKEAIKARLGTNQIVESKELTRVLDRQAGRGAETIAAQPGRAERKKALKTGVKKVDVTKQGMKAVRDVEQEARDIGVSREDYEFVERGLMFGFKAREEKTAGAGVSQADVKKELGKVKIPKGLDIIVVDKISPHLAELIEKRGYNPKTIRGAVMSSGKVLIVAGNHTDIKDVKATIAHELIGHVGVDGLLGEAGMKSLANKIQKNENSVFELAKKLNVFDDVFGAYAAARRYMSEEDAVVQAVRELIAHVEEARPNRSFLEKANATIKMIVGAVRSALRNMGLDLDISTSDIYKLLRDARENFKDMAPGAHISENGNVVFSGKANFNGKYADLGDEINIIVSGQKGAVDRIKASVTGMQTPKDIFKPQGILSEANRLAFRTRYIDRFAPIEKVAGKLAEKFKDSLKGVQLMYYMRMHDQLLNWTAQIASSGPIDLIEKKRADGKTERIIESSDKASLKKVAEALKKADVGDAQAANTLFTFYLAAKRAQRVGLKTLNFGPNVTQAKLDKVLARVNEDKQTKAAFDDAAKIYNEYNKGLVNFAVKTGALSKDKAKVLLETEDYIPFYRVEKDGEVVVEVGGATPVRIGNLKDQPYLHELVGGDTTILDVFTSALQNTKMFTDMALRNLATRNVAFSLQELGLLTKKKDRSGKEYGSGIYPGTGNADDKTIRFKKDGEDFHAIVDTDTVGIPAELLVQGMEGVKTSIPNLVRIAGIPAKLLRSYITRNPAYAVRQIARDSLSNAFTTGANSIPVLDNLKQLGSMWGGKNTTENILKSRGILGGQVIGGASDAMQKAMLQIVEGKPGWEKAMAYLDQLAIMGDASSRVTSYNSFIKQGLSDMEATLATLEAMNFNKRGTSPSAYLLNQMVPFLNAQIQGLDVLYKAFTGKMPFAEKLAIKQKILARGAIMAGMTMAYTAMKYDDDDYKNATPQQRIGNWFIKIPGVEESVKVPIPFEVGGIFKMLPEMIYSTAFKDKKLEDAAKEIADYSRDQFIPSVTPTALKPFIELPTNHSFFTGKPIESARLKTLEPGERAYASTPEALKALGEATNVSPVMMEYLLRNFTGSLPLAMLSLANPVISKTGEAAEGRGFPSSTTPVVGAFFQPKDANGLIDKAYEEMDAVVKAKNTYNNLVESGRDTDADEFLTKKADLIGLATAAGAFRQKMGDLAKQEREVHAMTGVSGKEKREMLDLIKQEKILLSKDLVSARE